MQKLKRLAGLLAVIPCLAIGLSSPALAADDGNAVMVYFSGIGCHECEAASPVILGEMTKDHPNLIVVDYEIYSETRNAAVLDGYVTQYKTSYEIPQAIFGPDLQLVGINAISANIKTVLSGLSYNGYPAADGTSVSFSDLDLDTLPGLPSIWHQQKVLLRNEESGGGELAKKLLLNDNLAEILASEEYQVIDAVNVAIPGGEIKFDNAIKFGGWVFQWNGNPITPPTPTPTPEPPTPAIPSPPSGLAATPVSASRIDLAWQDNSDNESGFRIEQKTGTGGFSPIASVGANVTSYSITSLDAGTTYTYRVAAYSDAGESTYTNEATATTTASVPTPPPPTPSTPAPKPVTSRLTIAKISSLAAADAVNPCAFSVLLLLLVSIIAYNPGNRKSILYAGLAFTGVVFGMYFLYGLVFIRFFQFIQVLAPVRFWLFTALSIAAIVFGAFNIRDFVKYKPGGVGTEMPALLRPKVKKLLANITSVRGAAVAGVLVTIFLLPCTIGPYIIAAGILSTQGLAQNVPPLLLYNAIFILPFIGITGAVYLGLGRVQDVYQWKQKNVTKMHLASGILIMGLGVFMLLESLRVLSTGFFVS